jgi:hypothetical protein
MIQTTNLDLFVGILVTDYSAALPSSRKLTLAATGTRPNLENSLSQKKIDITPKLSYSIPIRTPVLI